MGLFEIFALIVFVINIILGIMTKNFMAVAGWFCAALIILILSI